MSAHINTSSMSSVSTPLYQLVAQGTTIPELQQSIHEWAIRKEWRGEAATVRSFADEVALIASELFEALEAWRDSGSISNVWTSYTVEIEGVKFKDCNRSQLKVLLNAEDDEELDDLMNELGLEGKAMGVAPEMADTAIRLLETCEEYGIDLLAWIGVVMRQNELREVRHGGKAL